MRGLRRVVRGGLRYGYRRSANDRSGDDPPVDGGPNPEANLTAAVGEGLISYAKIAKLRAASLNVTIS